AGQYWNAPFTPSFTRPQLVEYVVLDILLRDNEDEVMDENKEEVKKKQIIDDENDANVAKKY
ncbi:60S ribosomal export protein NMD3, partial [Trifolium medium]|nr:60S ribosomal export protein NMD3 [Trifolium medium]